MSRNGTGTYSLPAAGNPVITNSVISSTWANTTFSDVATALTDSLSRTGLGGMSAPLKLDNGAIGAPALTFTNETTMGLYRAAAGDLRYAVGGADVLKITAGVFQYNGGNIPLLTTANTWTMMNSFTIATSGLSVPILISSATPGLHFNETGAAANNRLWQFIASSEDFAIRLVNDAGNAFAPIMVFARTANVVDSVTISATTFALGSTNLTSGGTGAWSGIQTFTASGTGNTSALNVSAAAPSVSLNQTGAAANNRLWDFTASGEQLNMRVINDASNAAVSWLTVDRTLNVVDRVALPTDAAGGIGGVFGVGTVNTAAGVANVLCQIRTTAAQETLYLRHPTQARFPLYVHNEATAGDNFFIAFGTEAAGTSRGTITYNRAGGLTAYNTTSSRSLKKNIRDSGSALAKIMQIKVRAFDWIEPIGAKLDWWAVADELEPVCPWAADANGVNPAALVFLAIKSIQEMNARLAAGGL